MLHAQNPRDRVLYFHTKGARFLPTDKAYLPARSWRKVRWLTPT
jgi:hypothetical protein